MQGSTITLAVLGVVLVLGIIGALKGLSRGITRQIVRTITVVGSAALAIWLTKVAYSNYFLPFFDGKTTGDIIIEIQGLGIIPAETDISLLANFDADTLRYLLTLPIALIVTPLAFIILFIIISALALIIHAIVCGLLGFTKKRNNPITRVLGMAVGAIQGTLVALLLLTPIIGYGQVYSETVAVLNEQMPESEATETLTATYDSYVKETIEHPMISFARNIGVDTLFDLLVTVRVEEDLDMTMTDEIPTIASIYADVMQIKGAEWKSLTPEQEAAVKSIITKIDSNDYLATILSGAISGAAKSYSAGAFNIGEIPEPFGTLINEAIGIFETSDRNNFAGDLDTITDVYFVLSRDQVFVAFEQGTDAMTKVFTTRDNSGKTPINHVIDVINSNPRIKPLVSMVAKLSVSLMAETLDLGADGANLYENVSNGLNATLAIKKDDYATEEEYVAAVSNSIDATLKENGITGVAPEVVDQMAQYVSDNNLTENGATPEDIILTYADAYADYMATGQLPDNLPDGLPDNLPDGLPDSLPGGDVPGGQQ